MLGQVEIQRRLSAPVISVILPVYNGAATIRETILSVLKQTFIDFELIIVDDGSLDNTREILSAFDDNRIRCEVRHHAGVSASRNHGVSCARGMYIAFIDADDLWMPEKLELHLAAFEKNPRAAVVYAWVDYIDKNDRFLFPGSHLSFSGNIYARLLVNDSLETGSNIMVRKEVFGAAGGFDQKWQFGQDWEWVLRVARKYLFESIPKVLVLYRFSAASCTSKDLIDFENKCYVLIDHIYSSVPGGLQYLKPLARANLKHHLFMRRVELFLSSHKMLFPVWKIWHYLLRHRRLRGLARRLTRSYFGHDGHLTALIKQ